LAGMAHRPCEHAAPLGERCAAANCALRCCNGRSPAMRGYIRVFSQANRASSSRQHGLVHLEQIVRASR
jgi:hypothetical protein